MSCRDTIEVEVAYALPERQKLLRIAVRRGCTALDAVRLSGICREFPEIDVATARMGIFGRPISDPEDHELGEGDRVEIYRPLLIDPRRARAARSGAGKRQTGIP